MPQQDIINAIHSLAKEGKNISTATVKARLNGSVELAALLPLISRYKQSPQSLPEADNTITAPADGSCSSESALADRVIELEARVAQLERLLSAGAFKETQESHR